MKTATHKMQPVKVFDKNGNLVGVATNRKEYAALLTKLPTATRPYPP